MSVFSKVTLASLKKNKTRTIVTIIGIMLSAAMICAVTTSIASLRNFLLKNMTYKEGSWHGSSIDTDKKTMDMIAGSDSVSEFVWGEQIGYAAVEGCTNSDKPYLYILGVSENFDKMMPIHLTSGSYPTADDEILLPDHLASLGGVTYKTGDVISLDVGRRVSDGFSLGQQTPLMDDESAGETEAIEVEKTVSYKVVGFYSRPPFEDYSAPGYTAITVSDEGISEGRTYDAYFSMNNPKDVFSFMRDNKLSGSENSDVLMMLGASRYNAFYTVLYSLAGIVIGLIMFGSISLIYNAFSISVSERTKQFGLLSSVGATKRQLRKMVLFEAMAVSAVGIPLGILLGIGGIGTTLLLIGNKFMQLGSDNIYPMRICVSPISIIAACVIAIITVLISAWIPSKRATRVSAVEAIRQTGDIKYKNENVKSSKLVYKLFGLPGLLANKYFKRNRKKYRATVVSLFLSIVLFISAAAFSQYLTRSVEAGFRVDKYDLVYFQKDTDQEKLSTARLTSLVKEQKSVTGAAYVIRDSLSCIISKDCLSKEYLECKEGIGEDITETKSGDVRILAMVFFVEDEAYKQFLNENSLNADEYINTSRPKCIAVDGQTVFDIKNEKLKTVNVLGAKGCSLSYETVKKVEGYYQDSEYTDDNGNEMCIYRSEENPDDTVTKPRSEVYAEHGIEIGTTVFEKPYFVTASAELTLLYPESLKETVMPEDDGSGGVNIVIKSDNHAESFTAIKSMLLSNQLSTSELVDYAEMAETQRNIILIVNVFAYGFIVLISLIATANVFNTISTNINLRRREFAMLKSVGMSKKGFNKMMNFECLLYGTKALLYGLPVSIGVTYLIHRSVLAGFSTSLTLPFGAIAIAVISVFAVVFATMLYAMSKIKKENPIDALKNDNF